MMTSTVKTLVENSNVLKFHAEKSDTHKQTVNYLTKSNRLKPSMINGIHLFDVYSGDSDDPVESERAEHDYVPYIPTPNAVSFSDCFLFF